MLEAGVVVNMVEDLRVQGVLVAVMLEPLMRM